MGGSWLITGGTGSFGRAFTRRLLDDGAERVVIFSRDELKQSKMRAEFNDQRLRFIIGTVCDGQRMAEAMHGVDYVAHAAAMKRVGACERNPWEAAKTNTDGVAIVARACINAGVKRAVFLSTDKAVAPNTLYGATKMSGERIWCASNVYAAGKATRFAATRYGNVLGSRGSVVPLFLEAAANGGPLYVTREATRFWMTLADATDLVLRAFRDMQGGEVFIPKVASSSVGELADALAADVPHAHRVLSPSEKMHETLISEDEARDTYDYGDHYRIQPQRTWEDVVHADIGAQRVPDGFTYRSDTNPDRLSPAALLGLLEDVA